MFQVHLQCHIWNFFTKIFSEDECWCNKCQIQWRFHIWPEKIHAWKRVTDNFDGEIALYKADALEQ